MIYEHYCEGCGDTFEVVCPVSEASMCKPCPRCNRPDCGRSGLAGVTPPGLAPIERWSTSLGCPVAQIPEMTAALQACGVREPRFHPETGAFHVRNKRHEKEVAKVRGMVRF